jgi:hypothetical protein
VGGSVRADVTVVNESNRELFVAAGYHVNGKIVYEGWKKIANGQSDVVYRGQESRVILCVGYLGQNNQIQFYKISNNFGERDYPVPLDGFKMEEIGGSLHEWKLTHGPNRDVYFKDDNNQLD